MRPDHRDCGDNSIQRAIAKRSCDAMRSDEMRRDPTFKRHGTGMTQSKNCREAQEACLPPISTVFVPLCRL